MDRILLAVDDSRPSEKAAEFAQDLLKASPHVKLLILYVTQLLFSRAGYSPLLDMEYEKRLALDIESKLRKVFFQHMTHRITFEHRTGVEPAKIICQTAIELDCDLIIVGSRGKKLLSRSLSGSVSHSVVIGSKVPVLIVRESERTYAPTNRVVTLQTKRKW